MLQGVAASELDRAFEELACRDGGIPEIVVGAGVPLLPPGDPEALARALQGFLDDPGAAKAQAERLRQSVQRRFAIGATTEAVIAFYGAHRAR